MFHVKQKTEFYDINPLLHHQAYYYIGMGERSNGKTFQVFDIAIFGKHIKGVFDYNGYLENGNKFAIIRRSEEDIKKSKGDTIFNNIVHNEIEGNILEKRTHGKWNDVIYSSRKWYFVRRNEKGEIEEQDNDNFAYAFSLSTEEHYKENSFPQVKLIFFDEFISRMGYLNEEFIIFMNLISTIKRKRKDVLIFMMANTINRYCPYFKEMGLTNVKNMKQGTIDIYTYGNTNLRVAVELTDTNKKNKETDDYFAFDNPKLKMITTGEWEIDIYPHLPIKYDEWDIIYRYFIIFDGETLQCNIINKNDTIFTYIHRKTTPIKDDGYSMIYTNEYSNKPNYRRKITKAILPIEKKIVDLFLKDKVFYQDNEIGEIVNNYIMWCKSDKKI